MARSVLQSCVVRGLSECIYFVQLIPLHPSVPLATHARRRLRGETRVECVHGTERHVWSVCKGRGDTFGVCAKDGATRFECVHERGDALECVHGRGNAGGLCVQRPSAGRAWAERRQGSYLRLIDLCPARGGRRRPQRAGVASSPHPPWPGAFASTGSGRASSAVSPARVNLYCTG